MSFKSNQKKLQAAWNQIEALGGHGVWEAELVVVSLAGTGIRDSDLAVFTEFSLVQILDLSNNELTDSCLEYLSGLTALEDLNLTNTRISALAIKKFQRTHPSVTVQTAPLSPAPEGSRDFWKVEFEFHPISNSDSRSMNAQEVKDLFNSIMGTIKRFTTVTKNWHASKRNGYDSVPVTFTQSNLDNVLKCSAIYNSWGKLDTHKSGYTFKLFTLDDQDERLPVELHLGGVEAAILRGGNLAFRVGTSWETLFLKSDQYQFIAELLERFHVNKIMLDSSATRNGSIGHINYFSKLTYNDCFVYIKKHFKIVNETENGILVEFCKINEKNRTVDVMELPHMKQLYEMIREQYRQKSRARLS